MGGAVTRWIATCDGPANRSLERNFGKAPQLAAVQLVEPQPAQKLDGAHADAQVLADTFAIELVGHARQLDFAV
jgi:hypothetical protein